MKLFAPESYWKDAIETVSSGGCGPGKYGDYLVPDNILGLSILSACIIHDFMYLMGETNKDKKNADKAFLNNMVRLIKGATKWYFLRRLRLKQAYLYYKAVKRFGGPSFWDKKNKPEEFRETK